MNFELWAGQAMATGSSTLEDQLATAMIEILVDQGVVPRVYDAERR